MVVLQPSDWNRIQNSLSGYNKEEARLRALHEEREALHNLSKETVKHWDNTIEVRLNLRSISSILQILYLF